MKKLLVVGSILVYYCLSIGGLSAVYIAYQNRPPEQATLALSTDALYNLVNTERVNKGLKPLVRYAALNKSASKKCSHMVQNSYWEHIAPDGTTPWYFIDKYTKYKNAGENLAIGYAMSSEVVNGWMNSKTHRANILDKSYTHVGHAVCGDSNIVVQHFIKR